ncbi:MAG TPA: hypothetical protein PKO30_09695 [Prolixibacteraceae bacterium]|nr:hypothetical protein [Prolixibacteraceae bacterium]
MFKIVVRLLIFVLVIPSFLLTSCGGKQGGKGETFLEKVESVIEGDTPDEYSPVNAMLVLPANPAPGQGFRVLATGGKSIRKGKIVVSGSSGELKSVESKTGNELPCWRIDDFQGSEAGNYKATLVVGGKELCNLEFSVAQKEQSSRNGKVWKTTRSWDSATETLYSAWINALFQGGDEQTSWPSLHEVTQNKEHNFLYNYLSLDEDNPTGKTKVLMEPDCADNPFFMRAYFAWKLGLPFGFHICDRGYVGKSPQTGQWITNETVSSKSNPVLAFNSFIRNVMNGVHSGTGRTALSNENSDYYPVALDRSALRPGTVFADPYGHTFVLVRWIPQTGSNPGVLLAADAQPDKTVAIKRFWKGNFLFNTSEVVGEPGFKAFRPIVVEGGKFTTMKNEELTASAGFAPFSIQQKNMESEVFYRTMDRVINPKPLDPEDALLDLIKALHEQLQVRVKSVANGEAFMQSHPGVVIPMPSSANGVFLAGGDWENYSTPNRDLRLLIAMDAVLQFPDRVARYPEDFKLSKSSSPDEMKKKLQELLNRTVSELSFTYTRSNGSEQRLTVKEALDRRDAFEMTYNPNDGVEIRWGAPEGSEERASCKRHAPANQQATMQKVRKWFNKRLHPPT